ncbi:MAG TPA: elongation factor P [Myxococcota bacterium]|nr:elongation factor P [Myxococcota bacterium]
MPDTSDFHNGMKLEIDGDPWVMTYFQHVKPGKGGAFVRTKIKNLRTGKSVDRTYRAGERVVEADVEDRTMQYLYAESDGIVCMDTQNYEQITIPLKQVGGARNYLQENAEVSVILYKGQPISIEIPSFVIARVVQTDPGVKGDTASGATKPAKIETGATVLVPLFIKEGETIRVDTRTGEYVERVAS